MDLARKYKKMWLKTNASDLDACERDWSYLPADIVDQNLDRLVALGDYVRFGAVCMYWRSSTLDDRNYRGINQIQKQNQKSSGIADRILYHQLPLLMTPRYNRACFYSVTNKKVLGFQLPFPYSYRLIGSSFGWLISVDNELSITLFNPFSGAKIQLPPVIVMDVEILTTGRPYTDFLFLKAILSADPSTHPNEFVVMVILGGDGILSFIRPGAGGDNIKQYRWFLYHKLPGFCDIIKVIKSNSIFYALRSDGRVFIFYTSNVSSTYYQNFQAYLIDNKNVATKIQSFPPSLNPQPSCHFRYLVETTSGDLLQVLRDINERSDVTQEFKVFKLNYRLNWNWIELRRLGDGDGDDEDQVLFLGDGCSSLAVKASDFPGCQPDYVYFTLPFPYPDLEEPSDMGFVNLQSGLQQPPIERFNISNQYFDCWSEIENPRPMWVVPTFQEPGQAVKAGSAKRPDWSLANSRIKFGWIKKNQVSS